MSTLTGAAKNTRDRSVLMDTARARTADRDHAAPGDVEALLRIVYALTPAKARRKLDEEGAAVIAQKRMRDTLKSTLNRTTDLDVFAGTLLPPESDPCGCLNNPQRWETDTLNGDPSGCYCECINDGNDDCTHDADKVIPAFFDLEPEGAR